jgi:hypothetical protein
MRAVKVIGLGIFFSFAGFVILLVIRGGVSGRVSIETSYAAGLSAVVWGHPQSILSNHLAGHCGRVRCCGAANAKDFQEQFHIGRERCGGC